MRDAKINLEHADFVFLPSPPLRICISIYSLIFSAVLQAAEVDIRNFQMVIYIHLLVSHGQTEINSQENYEPMVRNLYTLIQISVKAKLRSLYISITTIKPQAGKSRTHQSRH